jgi:hypothetical protein
MPVTVLTNDKEPLTFAGWRLCPIIVKDEVQLYDMFDPDGDWHGSRRTIEMCKKYIGNVNRGR